MNGICLKTHVFSCSLLGDNTPPQINCPPNINSVTQCGIPNGQLTFQQPTGTDNSGTPSVQCSATNIQLRLQGTQYSGNFPANQQTTVTCTATDACQLSSQCTFIASVSGGKSVALVIRTLCMLLRDDYKSMTQSDITVYHKIIKTKIFSIFFSLSDIGHLNLSK